MQKVWPEYLVFEKAIGKSEWFVLTWEQYHFQSATNFQQLIVQETRQIHNMKFMKLIFECYYMYS
jgi:hypothetical protein